MNFKAVYTDFEKRYAEKCEAACFVGRPLMFFAGGELTVGAGISAGGCISLAKRADGRIIIQQSDSTRYLSANAAELEYSRDEALFDLLYRLGRQGIRIGGARILLTAATELPAPNELLLLSALGCFCENVPEPNTLLHLTDSFAENAVCLASRRDRAAVFDGGSIRYAPLPDSVLKLVLCRLPERMEKLDSRPNRAREAVSALENADYQRFGELLNRQSAEYFGRARGMKKSRRLFEAAERLGDAWGSGPLDGGGIFAVVKNSWVDTFMHNLAAEYKGCFGGAPQFYVTRAEDSGMMHE